MTQDKIAEIAGGLSEAQRDELRHTQPDWARPKNFARARRLWLGISPRGIVGLVFLINRRHAACEYRLTPLGLAVKQYLEEGDRT